MTRLVPRLKKERVFFLLSKEAEIIPASRRAFIAPSSLLELVIVMSGLTCSRTLDSEPWHKTRKAERTESADVIVRALGGIFQDTQESGRRVVVSTADTIASRDIVDQAQTVAVETKTRTVASRLQEQSGKP